VRKSIRNTRQHARDEITVRLLAIDPPSRVYAGLLAYAMHKGWQPGWASHAFKEIFGDWPHAQDRVPAMILGNFLIEEWAATRKQPQKRKGRATCLRRSARSADSYE
jgi:hypothetical protein